MRTVTVNGREWEVGEDGRLKDRRKVPRQLRIRLSDAERTTLRMLRMCDTVPGHDFTGSIDPNCQLVVGGLVLEDGKLTPEGKLLADILDVNN